MENPQAQMPQGQPGMEQGQAPQQGGQDPQMQQIMQLVQQMMQQGVQPVEAAAELLSKQVPPEVIMQVFVQMGLPEQDAQMAIEQAMQGGQQPQGQGEEQMEGQASNPQEEMAEQQGAPQMLPEMEDQPPMAFGGQPRRMLRKRAEGGGMDPAQEMEAVMQQVQGMMEQGADAQQVMAQIQAAAQQGQISPEVATQVLEQLGGMQQAQNPQGDDAAMTAQSQDPQMMDPNMAAPDAQMGMAKFGGNLKSLLNRAYGGPAIAPGIDSKNYAKDRTSMFVNAVKNSAYKSTLDDEFPSLSGNQMAYGGNLPKASNGIIMKDGKLTIDPTQFKSEAEYKAAALDWNMDPANKDNQVTGELLKTNTWKEPEFKFEAGKQYELDPATGKPRAVVPKNQFQFAEGDIMGQDAQGSYVTRKDGSMQRIPSSNSQAGYNVSQSAINPVAYQNPLGNTLQDNLYASANPWARLIAGSGNRYGDARITGANLPGGMSGAQFFGTAGGFDGIEKGMTGKIGDQTWRVTGKEKFKEGSIWKGNRRKGVRYNIDWGTEGAMNPAGPQNNPLAGNSTPMGPQGQIVDPAITGNQGTPVLDTKGNQLTSDGSNMMWNSGNMPTLPNSSTVQNNTQQPQTNIVTGPQNNPDVTADNNQNLVTPAQSDVVNTASEVNPVDQNAVTVTKQTDAGFKGVDAEGALVGADYKRDRWDRQADRQERQNVRQERQENRQDIRSIKRENRQAGRAVRNMLNEDADQSQMPEVMQQAFQQQAYGGNVTPEALGNAIALINRAFGGMMPKALNGMDLGSEDTDANKIPDYLQAENLPANKPNPFTNKSTLEASEGKKFNVNWDAAADVYATSGAKFANFMDKVSSFQGNQERELAKRSALNRPSDTYDTMDQGMYDQWGNAKPNDLNNQVLNPTDVYRQNQRQVYAYGGRLYEIGGEVDLDDNEMQQLAAAGFKFSRV